MAAFISNPNTSSVQTQGDQDYIAQGGRWYKRSSVDISQEGGTDINSAGTLLFKNRNNVTIGKKFQERSAKHLIVFNTSFSTISVSGFGLSMYVKGAWVNFNNVHSEDNGLIYWHSGGTNIRDWSTQKNYGEVIWFSPANNRWLRANVASPMVNARIMKVNATSIVVVWECHYSGVGNIEFSTYGKIKVNIKIEDIDYLNLRTTTGNFKDGRMTVEWY